MSRTETLSEAPIYVDAPNLPQSELYDSRPHDDISHLDAELQLLYPNNLIPNTNRVEERMRIQAERAARLSAAGIKPTVAFLITGSGDFPDSESYLARVLAHGDRVGVDVITYRATGYQGANRDDPMTGAELKLKADIAEIEANPTIHGFLLSTPTGTDEGMGSLRTAASGSTKELDGLGADDPNNKGARSSLTAEELIAYVEYATGCPIETINPAELAVVGNGIIGQGVMRILESRGVRPGVFLKSAAQVRNFTGEVENKPLRAIISTARANGVIKASAITPPTSSSRTLFGKTIIADAGNAPNLETGEMGGSVDPATLPGSHVYASPFKFGIGPGTVAGLFDRVLDNAEAMQQTTNHSPASRAAEYVGKLLGSTDLLEQPAAQSTQAALHSGQAALSGTHISIS